MLRVTAKQNGVFLSIKVVPGSSRTRYLGVWNGLAKMAVTAPPEKGKANRAVTALLADLLCVRKRDVTVVAGHAAPLKTVWIENITTGQVRAALQPPRP